MPATRSANITLHTAAARTPPILTSSPQQRQRPATHDLDTISLTSSDGETSKPTAHVLKKSRNDKPQSRSRKPIMHPPPGEIIEISSDEEESSRPQPEPSIIADYRRQISRIREESVKHKRDFERVSKEVTTLREENQQLKALHKPDVNRITLDAAKIADSLDCEICTCRMWTPYILPNCGHSFCQSCLQDWFGATQAQFLTTHPEDLQVQHNYALIGTLRQLNHHPQLAAEPYIQALLASQMPPQPKYTCPTCREPVTSRPTEAFALKTLIHTIATAAGEKSPKKPAQSNKKGKALGVASGPWDGFFPPKEP